MTTSSRRSRRRGKTLIALFAATAALTGGAQGLTPAPAAAMIDQDMSESECNANFGSWDWFNEVCDLNFGDGGGGPANGGKGTAGGGGNSDGASGDGGLQALDALAKAEAQAAQELEIMELRAEVARLEQARYRHQQARCSDLQEQLDQIDDQWDGVIGNHFRGGRKPARFAKVKRAMRREECWRVIFVSPGKEPSDGDE